MLHLRNGRSSGLSEKATCQRGWSAGPIAKTKALLKPHPKCGPTQGGQTSYAGDRSVATGAAVTFSDQEGCFVQRLKHIGQ